MVMLCQKCEPFQQQGRVYFLNQQRSVQRNSCKLQSNQTLFQGGGLALVIMVGENTAFYATQDLLFQEGETS